MVEKYRKKPVVVEAVRFDGTNTEEVVDFIETNGGYYDLVYIDPSNCLLEIDTLEGYVSCSPGSWVIKGIAGEFYPCNDEVFKATYEKVIR